MFYYVNTNFNLNWILFSRAARLITRLGSVDISGPLCTISEIAKFESQ